MESNRAADDFGYKEPRRFAAVYSQWVAVRSRSIATDKQSIDFCLAARCIGSSRGIAHVGLVNEPLAFRHLRPDIDSAEASQDDQ